MSYKKIFAIPELVEAIREFSNQGFPEHQRGMDQMREHLLINESFELLNESYHSEHWMCSFVEYLQEYEEDELRVFSNAMKRCRCCSRHSHYKTEPKPEEPVPESKRVYGIQCACSCRHMYRLFRTNGLA